MSRTRILGGWSVAVRATAALTMICALSVSAGMRLEAQTRKPAAKAAPGGEPEIVVGGIRVVGPGYGNNRSEVRPFMEEPGTAVALIIKMPQGAGIIDLDEDDCALDVMTDDLGTDLLEQAEYGSFPKTSDDGTVGMIEIRSNLRPAAGAKAISAEGTLVFTSSTGVKPVKVSKVKFENGFAMKAGDGTIAFSEITAEGGTRSFSLAMTRAQLQGIKDARFFDAKGEAIPAQRTSSGYFNDEASISYQLETDATPAAVEFDMWQDLKVEKVPYKVSATLSLK